MEDFVIRSYVRVCQLRAVERVVKFWSELDELRHLVKSDTYSASSIFHAVLRCFGLLFYVVLEL